MPVEEKNLLDRQQETEEDLTTLLSTYGIHSQYRDTHERNNHRRISRKLLLKDYFQPMCMKAPMLINNYIANIINNYIAPVWAFGFDNDAVVPAKEQKTGLSPMYGR